MAFDFPPYIEIKEKIDALMDNIHVYNFSNRERNFIKFVAKFDTEKLTPAQKKKVNELYYEKIERYEKISY